MTSLNTRLIACPRFGNQMNTPDDKDTATLKNMVASMQSKLLLESIRCKGLVNYGRAGMFGLLISYNPDNQPTTFYFVKEEKVGRNNDTQISFLVFPDNDPKTLKPLKSIVLSPRPLTLTYKETVPPTNNAAEALKHSFQPSEKVFKSTNFDLIKDFQAVVNTLKEQGLFGPPRHESEYEATF